MITVESRSQVRQAKRKLRNLLKEYRITLKDVAENHDCHYHYQTVQRAFDLDDKYWNQTIADVAIRMVNQRKTSK